MKRFKKVEKDEKNKKDENGTEKNEKDEKNENDFDQFLPPDAGVVPEDAPLGAGGHGRTQVRDVEVGEQTSLDETGGGRGRVCERVSVRE